MTSLANPTTNASSLSVTQAFVVYYLEQADDGDLARNGSSSSNKRGDVRFDGSVATQQIIHKYNVLTETAYKSPKEKTVASAKWSTIFRDLEARNLIEGVQDLDSETNEPIAELNDPLYWKITNQGAVIAAQLRKILNFADDITNGTDTIDTIDALDAHLPPFRRRRHQRRKNDRRGVNDRRNELDRRATEVSSE
jgi:hypothetical protein